MNQTFEQVLEDNKDKVFRICRIYATSPIEPEDLFQEVVYQIWKSFSTFQGNSNISTWIYRIALNVCLRAKMKLDRKNKDTSRLESVHFATAAQTDEYDEERYQILKSCIAQLNEGDKSIIVLYLEELAYKEIAKVTGLTENHVAVKMKRIKKKLFDCVSKYSEV